MARGTGTDDERGSSRATWPPMSSRRGAADTPGDPLVRLGAAALSSGEVVVRVGGVRSRAQLDAVAAAVRGIRGIGDVRVGPWADRGRAELVLRTTRPVALAGELRRVLGRELRSCVAVDGRLELQLEPSGRHPADARPEARTGEHHAVPGALSAHQRTRAVPPFPTRPPGAARPDAGRRTTRPGAAPPPAGSAGPDAPGSRPAGPEHDGVREALDGIGSLSILTFDTDLRFVRAAGALHDRHEHDWSALRGRRPHEIVSPAIWRTLEPGYTGVLHGRTTTLDTPSPDGRRRYEATFRPLVVDGRVTGGTVTLLDVTAERQDGQRLDELRDVLAASFDGAPTGQALLSPEGDWVRVNAPLRRLLAHTDGSLLGTAVLDVVHPDDRGRASELVRAVQAGDRDGFDLETRMLRGDGTSVTVHARLSAVRTREALLRGLFAHVAERDHWGTGGG
ncbi:PAS domain-containing protein [Patulibacter sp. NPDC049589]|uniref:PAS domain-containing protein n=1 Tax=Patulibacter sp. NPDC049589 TaxID=3154731 RepID=UPI00343E0B27